MPQDLAQDFSVALQAPVFEIFLGRKCCIPSEMVYQGCFSSEIEAMQKLQSLADKKSLLPQWRYREITEKECDEETFFLADVPLRFGIHKLYSERYVKRENFIF